MFHIVDKAENVYAAKILVMRSGGHHARPRHDVHPDGGAGGDPGQRAGLDMDKVMTAISKGAAQSWQMENRWQNMVAGKFDYGFAVDWMRKDLGLVLDEARRHGARLPVTALIDQFYADVQGMGGGRLDTSSLIKRLR